MEAIHTSVLERLMRRMLLSDTIGNVFLQFKNLQQEAADQSITALRLSYLKTHAVCPPFPQFLLADRLYAKYPVVNVRVADGHVFPL
jgi:hypothetical protein